MSEVCIAPSFNLVDDPWVSCQMRDGTMRLLSLQGIFENLQTIRKIAGESPQQDYAVLRVILAIFWRTHQHLGLHNDYPEDWWVDLFEQVDKEEFVIPIREYLTQWKDRFHLIHPAHPFMQAPTLETSKGSHSGVQRLIPEAELDYFTLRAGQGREILSFDEATRWLIALHAWDYSGIKPGALGDPRVKGGKGYPIGRGWAGNTGGIVIHGEHLGQTLLLNTVPSSLFPSRQEALQDAPVWERETQTAAPRDTENPAGPCDVLTWQSRRVRLFTDGASITGALVCNGDRIEVRNQFSDPMTSYRYSKNQSKKGTPSVFFAKTHAEERTLWRGVEALLIQETEDDQVKGGEPDRRSLTISQISNLRDNALIPDDQIIRVELVGFVYGPQDSVIFESIHEVIPFKFITFLHEYSTQAHYIVIGARQAVNAAINLGQFAGFLKEAAGGTSEPVPEATRGVLHELEGDFKRWLLTFTTDTDGVIARDHWLEIVERCIKSHAATLAQGAGYKALVGRRENQESSPGTSRLLSTATAYERLEIALRKTLERTGER